MNAPECRKPAAWGTCIAGLAGGWHGASDLCPECTRRFMAALDSLDGPPLVWHENYQKRAAG